MIILNLNSSLKDSVFTRTKAFHRTKEDGFSIIGDYNYQRTKDALETVENPGKDYISWNFIKSGGHPRFFYLYNPKYNKSTKAEFSGFQGIQRRK